MQVDVPNKRTANGACGGDLFGRKGYTFEPHQLVACSGSPVASDVIHRRQPKLTDKCRMVRAII